MEGGSSGRKPSTAIEMTPAMDELVKRITVTVSHGFAADVVANVVVGGGFFVVDVDFVVVVVIGDAAC